MLPLHQPTNSKDVEEENEKESDEITSPAVLRQGNAKKEIGKVFLKAFQTEFFYFLVFDSGLAICSLISMELVKFLQVPEEYYLGSEVDNLTMTTTLYTRSKVIQFTPKKEHQTIWSYFMKIGNFRWAYSAAKKHGLSFLENVLFISRCLLNEVTFCLGTGSSKTELRTA